MQYWTGLRRWRGRIECVLNGTQHDGLQTVEIYGENKGFYKAIVRDILNKMQMCAEFCTDMRISVQTFEKTERMKRKNRGQKGSHALYRYPLVHLLSWGCVQYPNPRNVSREFGIGGDVYRPGYPSPRNCSQVSLLVKKRTLLLTWYPRRSVAVPTRVSRQGRGDYCTRCSVP